MAKQSLPVKIRGSGGCYTCRLRRKKCDETHPLCNACEVLDITCHYSDEKPEWMDGGPMQKEMTERIKADVKKQARDRREQKHLQQLEEERAGRGYAIRERRSRSLGSTGRMPIDKEAAQLSSSSGGFGAGSGDVDMNDGVYGLPARHPPPSASNAQSHDKHGESTSVTSVTARNSSSSSPERHSDLAADLDERFMLVDSHAHFVMLYLDFVFPYLFPLYRPTFLEGGRGWLLALLRNSKSLFYTTVSLTSYRFAGLVTSQHGGHDPGSCINYMWDRLQKEQEMALKELQQDMEALNTRGVNADLQKSARVMESILQLLVFDVSVGSLGTWQLHLDAATILFQQIVPDPKQWISVVRELDEDRHELGPSKREPWGTSQAAFRFFVAILLYVDVVSATILGRVPRLRTYYDELLCDHVWDTQSCKTCLSVHLGQVIGCENWVIRLIGDIAALDAWKKERQCQGSLSVAELVLRASPIEQTIRRRLEGLKGLPADRGYLAASTAPIWQSFQFAQPNPTLALDACAGSALDARSPASDVLLATQIWAHAALIYVHVVVSGWQPSSAEIASAVAQTTGLLEKLPTPVLLQSLVWPFCLTGCLAGRELEHKFRKMEGGILRVSESTKKALVTMEKVWSMRDTLGAAFDVTAAWLCAENPILPI